MGGAATSHSARQAGRYLAVLLRTRYRSEWQPYARRQRAGEINLLAVATVLARHLWDHPGRGGDIDVEPKNLVDAVWRAVHGRSLSRDRLELFIAAFSMEPADAETLRAQWEGIGPDRVIIGELSPVVGVALPPGRQRYRTIQLHEFHYLGPDGQPTHHRVVHQIRALVDDYTVQRYAFDTDEVSVERVHGGTPGEPYQLNDVLWAVDIHLPRTLHRHDTAPLEYVTRFRYKEPAPPYFNRAAHQPISDYALRVEFHTHKLPKNVWWAEWEDHREPRIRVVHQEAVELDAEHAVHRHLDYVERAVVGFTWEF